MSSDLTCAAASGDRLKALEVLRDKLAETIDNTASTRDLAALSKQMVEVLEQIDTVKNLRPGNEVTIVEEIILRHHTRKEKVPPATPRKPRTKNKPGA